MHWIYISIVCVLFILDQANCSGVFELRLKSFENEAGKDNLGKCCSGKNGLNTKCTGLCHTRFRVCLKQYQVNIDTNSPCTFGDVITPVLGDNSVNMLDSRMDVFVNPIRIPFNFSWPGTFSLIVEAWHKGNETSLSGRNVLISRLTTQRWLGIGDKWTEDVHHSTYTTMSYEFRVTCDAHYYGNGCERLCRSRDDQFGHYTCSPMGDPVCVSGWQGEYCSAPRCLHGCDEQHGSCNVPNECKCKSGWEGPLCSQCKRHPGCVHGSCIKPWDCLCDEGWGGLFCNQDLNFCTNHKPCRNGGTCFNTGQGSYTCNCASGYTGAECELEVDDCSHDSCMNDGVCRNNGTHFTCDCLHGFQGPRCEFSSQTCIDYPCRNGGTCRDVDGIYKCVCQTGYSGLECEHQVSNCLPNPCLNGGSCEDRGNSFRCNCSSGFSGTVCENNIDDCQGNPCRNGGTCIDQVDQFRCQCVPGYVGPLCQKRVDYCLAKPCANGGTCLQLTNDYRCNCAPGFSGKDCSDEIDECQSQPCQHGGTCINRLHGFECQCSLGFIGRACEKTASSTAPSARVSTDSGLTAEHVVVIATLSTFVPVLVLIAAVVVMCHKQRRKREQAQADEEARLQNEQNTHSSFAKRGSGLSTDAHMIKNSWNKCTNNVLSSNISSPDECSVSNISVSDSECYPKPMQVIDGRPVYTLHRTRSHKQLNTEPGPRTSALLSAKLHEPDYEPHMRLSAEKRISVLSNSSSVCTGSDSSYLKRPPLDKEPVYVIEEHFHRSDGLHPGLFATEV